MQRIPATALGLAKARLALRPHSPHCRGNTNCKWLEVDCDLAIKQRIGGNELELSAPA